MGKIHHQRTGNPWPYCGASAPGPRAAAIETTEAWSGVTCGNCLRFRAARWHDQPMEYAVKELVRVTNPNPRPVALWRGGVLTDILRPHDQLAFINGEDVRLTYERGTAIVVVHVDSADVDPEADEWLQQVTATPTPIDRKLAVDPKATKRAAAGL